MDKLESLYNVYKAQVEEIQAFLKNVNVYPDRYNITEDVNVSINQINISINEKTARWASDLVTIYFRRDFNEDYSISYNYGSGGWNDGPITEQMDIMSHAWAGAKHMVDFLEANKETLGQKLTESYKNYRVWHDAYEVEQRKENETKAFQIRNEIEEIAKNFTRINSIDELMDTIKTGGPFGYSGYGKVLTINPVYNGINLARVYVEYNKGQKTTFKFAGKRISYKDLKVRVENGIYVFDNKISKLIDHKSSLTFANTQQIKELLK